MGCGVDEIREVVGLMRRVPGGCVPRRKDLLTLCRCQGAEGASGPAPGGGGVIAHLLLVGLCISIDTGNALLGCFGGLEFGKQCDFVALATDSAAGGREPRPGDRARQSGELTLEFHVNLRRAT